MNRTPRGTGSSQGGARERAQPARSASQVRVRSSHTNAELLRVALRSHEEARGEFARELHDGVAQSVATLLWQLDTMSQATSFAETRAALAGADEIGELLVAQLREIRQGWGPTAAGSRRLAASLEELVADFRDAGGQQLAMDPLAKDLEAIDPNLAVALYRIVEAALANIRQHSQASRAHVSLVIEGTRIVLTVRDNGVGFDPSRIPARRAAHRFRGLSGMRLRAEAFDGTLELVTEKGAGCVVRVEIPSHRSAG